VRAFFEKLENGDKSQFFELLDQIDQKGIDLVQFAKQVIVYADQHLLENMDFYLKISQKLGDLLGVIRRYPHPRMAYKIVFNSFFDGEGVCVPSVQSKTVSKGDKKSDILPQISEQSTEKNQTSSSDNQQEQQAHQEKTSNIQVQEMDLSALWKKVIAGLKPTAQANLADGAVIEKISGAEVEIIAISSIAKMLLNNKENEKLIISGLEAELGQQVSLSLKSMSKDEYFAMKMGI
jgi:hypothetical protein